MREIPPGVIQNNSNCQERTARTHDVDEIKKLMQESEDNANNERFFGESPHPILLFPILLSVLAMLGSKELGDLIGGP